LYYFPYFIILVCYKCGVVCMCVSVCKSVSLVKMDMDALKSSAIGALWATSNNVVTAVY